MTPESLLAIVKRELSTAVGADTGKLSGDRLQALQYYNGELFGNEKEGRSQVIARTVLETVEWVLPALLRIFTASDKIAEIEPMGGGSTDPQLLAMREAAADQATQYVSYIWYKDNPGFLVLHDWIKDALLQKLGWIKIWWDEQKKQQTDTYEGLTEDQYQALKAQAGAEILSETTGTDPEYGTPVYDCKIKVTTSEGRVRIDNVPPEEVLFSNRAKAGDGPDNMPMITHRRRWVVSDLIGQGYDRDSVIAAAGPDEPAYTSETVERHTPDSDFPIMDERGGGDNNDPQSAETDIAMRPVWVDECYIWVDYDGDGIVELNKVVVGGNGRALLTKDNKPDIEPVDDCPLIGITPIPMPHKKVGLSVADLVMDIQYLKSVLLRQMLDNLYLTNNPRLIVGRGAVTTEFGSSTIDDILNHRPGSPIRAGDASQIVPLAIPFVAEKTFPALEYIDQMGEVRTGVSRHNQGLNPDDLNKTATGVNLIQQAADQRVELIARIIAETGVKTAVQRILGLITKYQQHERVIRLTGQWVPMDPKQWKDQMDVSVSVGLGTGNRDQIAAHLNQILQLQGAILGNAAKAQAPQFAQIVSPQNVYDAAAKLAEAMGFKHELFTDPKKAPQPGQPGGPQQPPPDPKMMQAQHEMQIAQQEAQNDAREQQTRLQADLSIQQAKIQGEQQLARERAQFEQMMDEQRFREEMALERYRADRDFERSKYEIDARAKAGAYTPGPRERR